ncbi:sigma-70 family RNA polymerase sigma factor [Acidobacteria bacterium AB60]|nr:sigma-70 family RNA polymerase sigma factor [Acidobacteria bacterium AB60]
MKESEREEVTLLLGQVAGGDQAAAPRLISLVYEDLRRLAGTYMRWERNSNTLQPTALVHEAYLRLVNQREVDWQGRTHFFSIAAQMMRRVLVDHARERLRDKRGGGAKPISLEDAVVLAPEQSLELINLNRSLERLTMVDPRQGQIVELRFFGGLSVEEVAQTLGVSSKTVQREWNVAKAWLHGDLKRSDVHDTR